jgi:hypothetical protein
MRKLTLEQRVTALEKQVAELQEKLGLRPPKTWIEQISGVFANDPDFDEAMRLGRKYRESLRPKSKRSKRIAKRASKRQK